MSRNSSRKTHHERRGGIQRFRFEVQDAIGEGALVGEGVQHTMLDGVFGDQIDHGDRAGLVCGGGFGFDGACCPQCLWAGHGIQLSGTIAE